MTGLLAATGSAFGRTVARTAVCNVGAAVAAGLSGILIARGLGAGARGDYAAVSVWLVLGQSAAATYFVARDPRRGRDLLATSRTLTTAAGAVVLLLALTAAPLLARGDGTLAAGYRLTGVTCAVMLAGFPYTAALQATALTRWNVVRVCQPLLFLAVVAVLHLAGLLTLTATLAALLLSVLAQTVLAYGFCRGGGLAPGHARADLGRPLLRYGGSQLATSVPELAVARLDQLVLTVAVAPAALGHYAVASSLTNLAIPVVSAIGHVAFPRLASAGSAGADAARLSRHAMVAGAGTAAVLTTALCLAAPWAVPFAFGTEFAESATLIWLLAPAAVLVPCTKVCADLLRGYGRPLAVAAAQAVSTGALAVLLAALVPAAGARGAAVAVSVTAAVSLALMLRALGRAPA